MKKSVKGDKVFVHTGKLCTSALKNKKIISFPVQIFEQIMTNAIEAMRNLCASCSVQCYERIIYVRNVIFFVR